MHVIVTRRATRVEWGAGSEIACTVSNGGCGAFLFVPFLFLLTTVSAILNTHNGA